ncbi:hypothetical protein, partial [Polaromonas eurypsychrophila]|uniref:hypothetical protein n=1 Tax=Polaromonas eurypsychrophila TaxID=1614635 RepID=UPI001E4B3E13
FDFFMAQSSQRFEPPQNTGRFSTNAIVGFKRKDDAPVYLWPLASALLDEKNYPVIAGIVVKGNVSFTEDVYAPTSTGGLRIQRVEFDIEIVSTTQPVPLISAFNYAGKTGNHVDAATFTFEGPDDQAWNVFVSKSSNP